MIIPLHSQGPDATDTREVSTAVPIEQIPYIMRAIGFYPSEQEVRESHITVGSSGSCIRVSDVFRLKTC